jgi:cyclase
MNSLNGESADPGTAPRMECLAPGVHAFVQPDGSWGLSNAGLVFSGNTVVLVDTYFTERRNVLLRKMVTEVAPEPPTLLVNTHHHGDHVYGNGWFPEAVVVSHEDTRNSVLRLDSAVSASRFADVDFGETRPTPASITFRADLRLHAGDMPLDVIYPGLAHCVGNTVVHLPGHGILFAGDLLMKDCTPSFSGGSALGFLSVLERLRGLGAKRIVPGHGPTCDAGVIDDTERYVRFVLDLARAALADGLTPLDAARAADLGDFAGWRDHERLVGNLYRAFAELAPLDAPRPVDVPSMWRDTEAFLGSRMRSLALRLRHRPADRGTEVPPPLQPSGDGGLTYPAPRTAASSRQSSRSPSCSRSEGSARPAS